MHRYSLELRIVGKDLEPENITRELGMAPTQVRKQGEPRNERSRWPDNTWSLDILTQDGRSDWSSLEEGLAALLRMFDPIRDQLRSLAEANKILIWCGHFTSSFDGGPTLSAAMMKSLGEFGAELVLDTYCERSSEN